MARIITDYLDASAENFPDKIGFVDEKRQMTFREMQSEAEKIAAKLIQQGYFHQPIAVFLDKSVECIASFQGIAYSGNFYTPLDTEMPSDRVTKIFSVLQPAAVVTDKQHQALLQDAFAETPRRIFIYEEMMQAQIEEKQLRARTEQIIDTDVLYVMFTSGSTGVPKGVIISHRAVIDHAEWAAHAFQIDGTHIFANQAPFYFDHSILEIYQTLRNGALLYILPRLWFSFPKKLMAFLMDKKVNTIIWVPSVLCYLADFRAVDSLRLPNLKKVMFGGEVMPVRQLNIWRRAYPEVMFVNLYGPTEAADDSTYYIVERELAEDEPLPIGRACRNMGVFVLDSRDELVTEPEHIGELCVRGSALAYGYYRNPQKTKEAFVQNPLNTYYEEKIYRTGDLVKYNSQQELVYIGRKDFQIKHQGQRIELGEIETAVSALSGVERNCCLYDAEAAQLVLFYTGEAEGKDIAQRLQKTLPGYMIPHRKIKLPVLPLSPNGKIDRKSLSCMLGKH